MDARGRPNAIFLDAMAWPRDCITQRRFVHMGAAHLGALETTIVPGNWSGRLRVRTEIDGTVTNSGVPRYRELASRHLVPDQACALPPDGMLLVVETSQSCIRIAEAARTRMFHDGVRVRADATVTQQPGRIGQEFGIDVAMRDTVVIEKIVAITTSRDRAVSDVGIAAAGWRRPAHSTVYWRSTRWRGRTCGSTSGSGCSVT